jgi:F-type H+-transporting ATPase subunit b
MAAPFMWVIINFTVAFMLLAWQAGPPLRRYLEGRHLSVRESLEEAAKLREQAQAKLDEYTSRIEDVEKEVETLLSDIRAHAAAEKERILADAEDQAAKLKQDAEDRIASEIVRARLALEREVVFAAVNAAEKILRDKANAGDKTTLVNDFITSIESQERA